MSSTTYKTLIMQENYDNNNTPFTPLITQIDRITGCLTIITEQIIDELEGLEVLSPSNLIQVFDEADLIGSNNKYFVLYGMGQIKFSSNLVGTEILIKFGGKGSLFLDASRVATVIDSNGNVVETLHDVITEARTALELIKTANDLVALDTTIKSDITNAQNICGELENDTMFAEAKKVELNTSITNSIDKKTELDASITTANNKKTELESVVATGNTLKTTLEADIGSGSTLHTNLGSDIATANTAIANMNTAIANGNVALTNLNNAIANSDLDNKQDKTDNSLNTTNKTVVGAINELNTSKANKADFTFVGNDNSGYEIRNNIIEINIYYELSDNERIINLPTTIGRTLVATVTPVAGGVANIMSITPTTITAKMSGTDTKNCFIFIKALKPIT